MRPDSIVVLGGYGRLGRWLSDGLAEDGVPVVIAGRRREHAEQCAAELREQYSGATVSACHADAHDPRSLGPVLSRASALVVAAPLQDARDTIVAACVENGCDCIDTTPSTRRPVPQPLASSASRGGRLIVTQAGLCPGLPSFVARIAGRRTPDCHAVRVGMAISLKGCERAEQVYQFIDAAADYQPCTFLDGQWQMTGRRRSRAQFDFGAGFGAKVGVPIDLPEMHGVELELGLSELGAFAATADWRVDALGRMTAETLYRFRRGLGRHALATLLLAMARRSSAPRGARVTAVATGRDAANTTTVTVGHRDAVEGAAIVLRVLLRQLRAGVVREVGGVRLMGHLLAEAALDDMTRLGLQVEWRQTQRLPAREGLPWAEHGTGEARASEARG